MDEKHSVVAVHVRKIQNIHAMLGNWYSQNKRSLPWRDLHDIDLQNHAYRVLVSEVMLQQTQVSVVKDYYNRWICRWPTLESLSSATLEQVQTEWKGLGYYSRARRLLNLAQKVKELPDNAQELAKLPGIGTYTAGAIASIVFNEPVPAVDGNVTRVLCRLRAIGGVTATTSTKNQLFEISNDLMPLENPGDWNQALIELGATVCTPRLPDCVNCPINSYCRAYSSTTHDIEDCKLCLPGKRTFTPLDFPVKGKKILVRKQLTIVCILCYENHYFVVKRNSTGLLADLWQFPNFPFDEYKSNLKIRVQAKEYLKKNCNVPRCSTSNWIGRISHKFSHIDMTYKIVVLTAKNMNSLQLPPTCCAQAWVTQKEFKKLPVSTAMRKVFDAYLNTI